MKADQSASAISRRRILRGGVAAAGGVAMVELLRGIAGAAEGNGRRPNFVFIFCDDLGYGDLGCYGNSEIRTPNLDRMAEQGLKMTSFYAAAPVCTPSRAAFVTARYPIRCGLTRVLFPNDKVGMPDSEITLAQALRELGYATACIGKWHLGHLPQFLPTRHGFDRFFGIPYSNDMKPRWLMRDENVIEETAPLDTLTQRYTAEAVKFMEESKGRPFFLYLAHTMPHVPLGASEAFKGKSKRGLYGDVVEELDWSVGQVLEALKRLGLEESTLVVFSSDNGPWLSQGKNGGSAGKLRNGKGTTFEGGMREPCIARWPGKIKAGRVDNRPAMMIDLFPTFVALAGGKMPGGRIIDGRDISGLLLGTGVRADEDFFYWNDRRLEAMRSGRWKLKLPAAPKKDEKPGPVMLFDLEADPNETTNLAAQNAEVVARLRKLMSEHQKTVPGQAQ